MMEDLDLDELDQAVNTIMTKPKKRASHKKAAQVPTVAATSATPMAEPEPVKVATTTTPSSQAPPLVVPPDHGSSITVKRPMPKVPERARMHPGAMDIIQPQMPKLAPPSARPARVAAPIAPTQPVKPEPVAPKPEPVDVSDDVLASLSMSDEPHGPQAEPHKKSDHETWPDPLDFHSVDKPEEAMAPELPKEAPPSMEPKEHKDPDALLDEEPVNATPFVMTKVEKRPLGAYADANKPAEPAALPENDTPNRAEMAAASLQSSQHLAEADEPEHDMQQLRTMAIPQQYHTAEPAPSTAVHNVFDTKEYHATPQPVHPAKRSGSPWFVIAVIVLVLLIVVAIVVGYFMMTGTLNFPKIW